PRRAAQQAVRTACPRSGASRPAASREPSPSGSRSRSEASRCIRMFLPRWPSVSSRSLLVSWPRWRSRTSPQSPGPLPPSRPPRPARRVPARPPLPPAPVLPPPKTEPHIAIGRTALPYRLVDGREIEGWGPDLYTPRDASSAATSPRESSSAFPVDSTLSMRSSTTEGDTLDLVAEADGTSAATATSRALIVMLPAGGFRTDLADSWAA